MLLGVTLVLGVVNVVILSQALGAINQDPLFVYIYPSARQTGQLVCLGAAIFIGDAVIGFVAGFKRYVGVVKFFMFFTFGMLIFNLVCFQLVKGLGEEDQLKVQVLEFKQGWMDAVAEVAAGNDESGVLTGFFSDLSNAGNCCGFDSTTDLAQNPAVLRCSRSEPCQEFLAAHVSEEIQSLSQKYIVLAGLMATIFAALVFFLIRVIPQPVHREFAGGYYYV